MRIKTALNIAALSIAFLFQSTLKAQTMNTNEAQNTASICPKGEKATQNFTGTDAVVRFCIEIFSKAHVVAIRQTKVKMV